MIPKLTLNQMFKAYTAVKKLPKASYGVAIPKKTGMRKPFFPKSKIMPEYSLYDVATDLAGAGLIVGGYAGYKKLTKKDKDNNKKKKG